MTTAARSPRSPQLPREAVQAGVSMTGLQGPTESTQANQRVFTRLKRTQMLPCRVRF